MDTVQRKRQLRYSPNGQMKLCKGPLHAEGVMVPITEFSVHKSGEKAGKLMFACNRCIRMKRGLEAEGGYVRAEIADPVFNRLVEYMGSKLAVCTALGKDKTYLSRRQPQYRFKTVDAARTLLAEIEKDFGIGHQGLQGDALVVEGEMLAPHLQDFVEKWNLQHPPGFDGARRRRGKQIMEEQSENVYFMGPLQFLHEKSNPAVTIRRIGGMVKCEYDYVGIRHVDPVLTAANLNYLIMEFPGKPPVIPVIPNPEWPMEKWLKHMFYDSMG